jgi:hypothetical protein
VTAVGGLVDQGGIGGLAGSESELELEFSLGGPGDWEVTGMNFLGSLEIPPSEKGSSWWLGCLVFALVGEILMCMDSW